MQLRCVDGGSSRRAGCDAALRLLSHERRRSEGPSGSWHRRPNPRWSGAGRARRPRTAVGSQSPCRGDRGVRVTRAGTGRRGDSPPASQSAVASSGIEASAPAAKRRSAGCGCGGLRRRRPDPSRAMRADCAADRGGLSPTRQSPQLRAHRCADRPSEPRPAPRFRPPYWLFASRLGWRRSSGSRTFAPAPRPTARLVQSEPEQGPSSQVLAAAAR